MHENMFSTVATGLVVDELPKNLISVFLSAIQQQEAE